MDRDFYYFWILLAKMWGSAFKNNFNSLFFTRVYQFDYAVTNITGTINKIKSKIFGFLLRNRQKSHMYEIIVQVMALVSLQGR